MPRVIRALLPPARAYPPLSCCSFATKLKLHPLLVLIALYMTEHLVGVKGLFLALPVTVYIVNLIFSVKDTSASATSKDGGGSGDFGSGTVAIGARQ